MIDRGIPLFVEIEYGCVLLCNIAMNGGASLVGGFEKLKLTAAAPAENDKEPNAGPPAEPSDKAALPITVADLSNSGCCADLFAA